MDYKWIAPGTAGFADVYSVRYAVFVEEQEFSAEAEFDAQDKHSMHLVGYLNKQPVCTARLFEEVDTPGVWHIGRVAVLPVLRGQGVGLTLMNLLAEKAKQLGARTLVLNAQANKTAFYQRAGFTSTGEENLDEGVPHVWMRCKITE